MASGWLKRGRGQQMATAAALAEEHFVHREADGEATGKKQKTETEGRGFVAELLEKAPSTLQTCRSLLVFLDKKLEAAAPEAPPVGGPEELRSRLQVHADTLGRLTGLRAPAGWDARAKRVLDITAAAACPTAEAKLKAVQDRLDAAATDLAAKLKERGETLEAVTAERQSWAKEKVRREWLSWCARLLRVRETHLLAEVDGQKAVNTGSASGMTAVDILEALLIGKA
ncbi:unnamed protein product [Polarella glacialis]|uniref:Uncharacterized protein n=1 Tax=Polarella glacialis TaxID=89957 RepID=A0A813H521_POLGL|nr:unnamed protein product [Polarella glacialis]